MDINDLPVLSVKFKAPSPRDRYVVRKKLMDILDGMSDSKLTIIKAGAGSGKTSLMSMYMKERNITDMKWITMDSSMNQVFLFWRYVIQAIDKYIDRSGESLKSCFESNMQMEMLQQMIPVLAGCINDSQDIYLVMDDFQTITDNRIMETLDSFINSITDNLHLVILTRQMPEIDVGNLYMEGSLLLIDEEDIRFSDEETVSFLMDTLNTRMNQEQIDKIVSEANGWVGGAQLMAIAGGNNTVARSIHSSANDQIIYDYINREIFSALTDEERSFLIQTAIPSYFNEDICKLYVPDYNFLNMMKLILDKNLFVIRIDEEKNEYRYHGILREFLLLKADQDMDMKVRYFRNAAAIFMKLHDYDECVRLLFEIRDYSTLMKCLMDMPQNVATFSYMMKVPLEAISGNVNFAYQYFFCYYASLQLNQCKDIYEYIKTNFKEDETFRAFKHSNLFFDINWEFKNVSIMTLQQIQEMQLNEVTEAYLLIKEAYFLFLADRIKDAMEYLDEAERIYKETHNIYIECFVELEKTQILEEHGELNMALEIYKGMAEVINEVKSMKCSYYIGISGLHIRQKRLAEAKQELDLVKESIDHGIANINSAYLYTLAEWYYISGYPDKTMDIVKSLAQNDMYSSIFFSARLLRYSVYKGRDEKLARAFLQNYEKADDYMRSMDTDILYDGIVYDLVDKDRAMELIDDLVARARKTGNKIKIVEGSLMKMRFLYEQEAQKQRILNLLVEAVTYAYPEHLEVPFWFEKTCISKILMKYKTELTGLIGKEQVAFLVESISDVKIDESINDQMGIEVLSDREIEVLKEMAYGYTNKEIAEHLCISLATVKTHVINIYGKLGVNNRVAAATKYKEANLLSK